jgi:hypothetical protein
MLMTWRNSTPGCSSNVDGWDSECGIARLLPKRKTPELAYLCAKHGASSSYRTAATKMWLPSLAF